MNWIRLEEKSQLEELLQASNRSCVLIFKNSTTCSLSRTILDRLQRNWQDEEMENVRGYILDVRAAREISNEVAHQFGVVHESPQLLLIRQGEAVYNWSHFDINCSDLRERVKQGENQFTAQ